MCECDKKLVKGESGRIQDLAFALPNHLADVYVRDGRILWSHGFVRRGLSFKAATLSRVLQRLLTTASKSPRSVSETVFRDEVRAIKMTTIGSGRLCAAVGRKRCAIDGGVHRCPQLTHPN